jgi:hypothetical protein
MQYRIQPKEYLLEKYVIDYYYYTKKEAIARYRKKFPQFKLKELLIEKF